MALLASTKLDRDDSEWSPEIAAFRAKEEALVEAGDIAGAVALGLRAWKPRPGVRDLVEEMTRDAFELQQGVEAQERELPVDLGAIAVPTLVVSGGKDPMPDFARDRRPARRRDRRRRARGRSRTPATSSPWSGPTPRRSCSSPG